MQIKIDMEPYVVQSPPKRYLGGTVTPQTFWKDVNLNRLAKELNISRQAVHSWTRREKGVPAERVSQVAAALGVKKQIIRPDLYQ